MIIDQVMKGLQQEFRTRENWTTQTGWLELTGRNDLSASAIVAAVKKGCLEFLREKGHGKGSHRGNQPETRAEGGERREERLERMLVASSDGLFNQYNFLSGTTLLPTGSRRAIDIIVMPNKESISEMIELKAHPEGSRSPAGDHPLYALVELLAYFALYIEARRSDRTLPKLAQHVKLTVLAPEVYYMMWCGDGAAGKNRRTGLWKLAEELSMPLYDTIGKGNRVRPTVAFKSLAISDDMVKGAQAKLANIRQAFRTAEVVRGQ